MSHNLNFTADFLQIFLVQIRLFNNFNSHTSFGQTMYTQSHYSKVPLAQVSWSQVIEANPDQTSSFWSRHVQTCLNPDFSRISSELFCLMILTDDDLILQGGWCVEAKNYNGVVQVIIWDDVLVNQGVRAKIQGGLKMFCQTSPSFLAAVPSSIVVLLAKKNGSEAAAAALADSSRGCAQCW